MPNHSRETKSQMPFDFALVSTASAITPEDLRKFRNSIAEKYQLLFDEMAPEKQRLMTTLDMMSKEELDAFIELSTDSKNLSLTGANELNNILQVLLIYREKV